MPQNASLTVATGGNDDATRKNSRARDPEARDQSARDPEIESLIAVFKREHHANSKALVMAYPTIDEGNA
jgi:hypothetical protein